MPCEFYLNCGKRDSKESELIDNSVSEDSKEQARAFIENSCKGNDYRNCPVYHIKLKRKEEN